MDKRILKYATQWSLTIDNFDNFGIFNHKLKMWHIIYSFAPSMCCSMFPFTCKHFKIFFHLYLLAAHFCMQANLSIIVQNVLKYTILAHQILQRFSDMVLQTLSRAKLPFRGKLIRVKFRWSGRRVNGQCLTLNIVLKITKRQS